MAITRTQLLELTVRRLNGQATPEEAVQLDGWAAEDPMNRQWLNRMTSEEQLEKEIQEWKNIDPTEGYARWAASMEASQRPRIRRMVAWSAAAAAVLIGVIFIRLHRVGSGVQQAAPVLVTSQPVVLPGRSTATLTLANGRTLLLDSAGTGHLATQGNAQVSKLDSGSLAYSMASGDKDAPVAYNVLTTPKSGQFQVILPDGSHVWLNNVSSLRYPTAFRGANRRVELTGEGYFEIAKVPGKPFIVSVNGEEIEVLGTSFNIMAYSDEGTTQTTLLTGSVRVKAGNSTVQLRPDEQAQWSGAGSMKVVPNVPSQDIISWKNGFFYFGRASFKEVMRQLARWYDVDVQYQGTPPDIEFGGKIDRDLPLNDLLHFLDKNQVHFKLNGRTLMVLPS